MKIIDVVLGIAGGTSLVSGILIMLLLTFNPESISLGDLALSAVLVLAGMCSMVYFAIKFSVAAEESNNSVNSLKSMGTRVGGLDLRALEALYESVVTPRKKLDLQEDASPQKPAHGEGYSLKVG